MDRLYLQDSLWPAEIASLLKYQNTFVGRSVLDIGTGPGRTTRYLAPLARRYVGIDYSPVMVECGRAIWPHVDFRLQDMRDLSPFSDGSFDFVIASANVLDAVSHVDRLTVFREVHRVLAAAGTFVMTSHNRSYIRAGMAPRPRFSRNPVTQLKYLEEYVRCLVGHIRHRSMRWSDEEYALLDDGELHKWSLLHYYISRDAQLRQARRAGFEPLDTFANSRRLAAGDDGRECLSLLYVLRRSDAEAPDVSGDRVEASADGPKDRHV